MKHYAYLILTIMIALSSCSTQKNTTATRAYHQMKTRYNVYYNGHTSYQEGQIAIADAAKDDYGMILSLYPVSDHNATQAATSQMDRTIEKCRKCIKLHSIKSKPKPDPKKAKDPKYKQWLKQGEFNKEMSKAWVLLGQAEFHKGDFIGSVGTFNYIINHYDWDKDIIAQCQLWIARAYGELGWLYEAEDMLMKVQPDDLKRRHASLFSEVSADIRMKTGKYNEAIPFVKLSAPSVQRHPLRPRFYYVMGQLYERQNNRAAAVDAYKHTIHLYPTPEMEFNARLRIAELQTNSNKALRQLKRMARYYKNREKLDLIYTSIGNIYMGRKDTTAALKAYATALEKSKGGITKVPALLTSGQLYYDRKDYVKAGPCYTEAVTIISTESPDYPLVRLRADVLDKLVIKTQQVVLQDSLQVLSQLSPEEQQKVAEQLVADLIKAEEAAADSATQAARAAKNGSNAQASVNTSRMMGGGGQTGSWYFYNPQLIRNGKQEWARRWGNRPLEDNWRRLSKTSSSSTPWTTSDEEEEEEEMYSIAGDSTMMTQKDSSASAIPKTSDPHDPAYYLQQIPKTKEDIAVSDSLIADALFEMIYIYQDELKDTMQADAAFAEFRRRFPADRRMPDVYYLRYLSALKKGNTEEATKIREEILSQFPSSTQASIVSDPNYFERLRRMTVEQDSLYEDTYKAYTKNLYATVKSNTQYAEQNYPLSPLMPRFLFLNAIATAKTEGQPAFIESLRDMVNRYPDSELSTMAKDMLAMIGQGMESKRGGTTTTLANKRAIADSLANVAASDSIMFFTDRNEQSYVLLVVKTDADGLNNLLYEVALFNFSQFMIKDFDLTALPAFEKVSAIKIGGFDSIDEAEWFVGLLSGNQDVEYLMQEMKVEIVTITDRNYTLINSGKSLEEYNTFIGKN